MISIYTDGSSNGRSDGAVGWGWIIVSDFDILGCGAEGEPEGTNNTAELKAAIYGLKDFIARGLTGPVEIVSDSQYVLGLGAGTYCAVKNTDLANELRQLVIQTGAKCRWVRGHSGDPYNEMTDKLAKTAKYRFDPPKPKPKAEKKERRRADKQVRKAKKKAAVT
jgi:ribonuclease HI